LHDASPIPDSLALDIPHLPRLVIGIILREGQLKEAAAPTRKCFLMLDLPVGVQ
jgi:hypothetical protein